MTDEERRKAVEEQMLYRRLANIVASGRMTFEQAVTMVTDYRRTSKFPEAFGQPYAKLTPEQQAEINEAWEHEQKAAESAFRIPRGADSGWPPKPATVHDEEWDELSKGEQQYVASHFPGKAQSMVDQGDSNTFEVEPSQEIPRAGWWVSNGRVLYHNKRAIAVIARVVMSRSPEELDALVRRIVELLNYDDRDPLIYDGM